MDEVFYAVTFNHDYNDRVSSLHFQIWKKLKNVSCTMYSRNMESSGFPDYVMVFKNKKEATDYKDWEKEYHALFPKGMEKKYVLPPPIGGNFPCLIEDSDNRDRDDLVEKYVWGIKNCKGRVAYLAPMWFFENEEDMAMFRIKF